MKPHLSLLSFAAIGLAGHALCPLNVPLACVAAGLNRPVAPVQGAKSSPATRLVLLQQDESRWEKLGTLLKGEVQWLSSMKQPKKMLEVMVEITDPAVDLRKRLAREGFKTRARVGPMYVGRITAYRLWDLTAMKEVRLIDLPVEEQKKKSKRSGYRNSSN
ncbi:MAG: hypothetical protein HY650_02065 [Acidobacteria bacterium]|nr:hypothetical protein [Acidobacteriota bacterium]